MLTVNTYTAQFDAAMRPTCPKIGQKIKMHDAPDARESDALTRLLRNNGRELEFDRTLKNGMDIWTVIKSRE